MLTKEELIEMGFTPKEDKPIIDEKTASEMDFEALGFTPRGKEVKDSRVKPVPGERVAYKEQTFEEPDPSEGDTSQPVATSYEAIYYGGKDGERIQKREAELEAEIRETEMLTTGDFLPAAMQASGIPATDILGVEAPLQDKELPKAKAELAKIKDIKQKRFDNIKGDNVVSVAEGWGGKIINNPDGSSNYVPPPYFGRGLQTTSKAVSDTARGLLALPELVGAEGYQDIVPKVSSEDEAVIVASELLQLTFGGMAGLKLAEKATKIAGLAKKVPVFSSLFVEGTVGTSLGGAAVADEDIGTFFGDKDMTMTEAKLQFFMESMAMGSALKAGAWSGEQLGKISALKNFGAAVAKTLTFMSSSKREDAVIDALATRLNEGVNLMAKAKTPEEIREAQLALYDTVDQNVRKSTGMSLDEFMATAGEELPESTFLPAMGESMNDASLTRMYTGIRLSSSKDKALEAMSTVLQGAEQKRIDAIVQKGEKIVADYAPEGKQTAEMLREEAQTTLEGKRAAVETDIAERTAEVEARTDQQLAANQQRRDARLAAQEQSMLERQRAVEEQTTSMLGKTEEEIAAARQAKQQAAEQVQTTMEELPVSTMRIDDLANTIDDSGDIAPISATLRRDVETKNTLASNLDREYEAVPIAVDDLADLLDSMSARAARSELIDPEAVKNAFIPVRRLARAISKRLPEPDEGVEEQIRALEAQLAAVGDPTEGVKLANQISELMRDLGTGTPLTGGTMPEAADLLPLTAKDLLEVSRSVGQQSRELRAASVQGGAMSGDKYNLGDYLRQVDNDINSIIDSATDGNATAQAARQEFDEYFQNVFAERWRTETGRDWQAYVFDPTNVSDVAKAQDRILKVVSNPKADKQAIAQIEAVMGGMDDVERDAFANSMAPRIAMDFAQRNKGILLPKGEAIETVAQAQQALRAVDQYMAGAGRYFEILPGSDSVLRSVKNSLETVVDQAAKSIQSAEAAITAGKQARTAITAEGRQAQREVTAAGKQQARDITREATETERALNQVQKEALNDINAAMRNAQKKLNDSALARLVDYGSDPSEYFAKSLTDPKRGYPDIADMWTAAGKQGPKNELGLTQAQQAIKEAVTEALMSKTTTAVSKATDETKMALRPLLNAVETKGSTANKILDLVYQNDAAGMEMFEQFGKSISTLRKSATMRGAEGSPTAEKLALQGTLQDLNMVIFGPLTKEARFARYLTKLSMGMFGTDVKVGKTFAKIMSDARYSKRVIDRAAELREQALMPPEEAFGKAFLQTYMVALGYKEFEKASDPWLELRNHYASYTQGEETEEAFNP